MRLPPTAGVSQRFCAPMAVILGARYSSVSCGVPWTSGGQVTVTPGEMGRQRWPRLLCTWVEGLAQSAVVGSAQQEGLCVFPSCTSRFWKLPNDVR